MYDITKEPYRLCDKICFWFFNAVCLVLPFMALLWVIELFSSERGHILKCLHIGHYRIMRACTGIAICVFFLHRSWDHSPVVSERVVTSFVAHFHLVESGYTVLGRIWCCTASPQHQGSWSGLWMWVSRSTGSLWWDSWHAATPTTLGTFQFAVAYLLRVIKATE